MSPGVIGERLALLLASTSMDLDAIDIGRSSTPAGMTGPDFVFNVMGMGGDPAGTGILAGPLPALYRDALLRDAGATWPTGSG